MSHKSVSLSAVPIAFFNRNEVEDLFYTVHNIVYDMFFDYIPSEDHCRNCAQVDGFADFNLLLIPNSR